MRLIPGAEAWIEAFKQLDIEPPSGDSWEPYLIDFLNEENK